jgi:DNA repair photolyase
MSKQVKELKCKTLLVDVSEYTLNFLIFPHRLVANGYVGCQHSCGYCYARWYCKHDEIRVKTNAPEILRKELESRIRKGNPREPVCFGSISDPYQQIEKKYQITHKMLEICDELSYPTIIVTKSNLVQNDISVLSSLAKRNLTAINLTVTPLAAKLLNKLEPHAPSNNKRLEAMKTLTQSGIPCNLYLSPILPVLSSKYINYYIEKAAQSGANCCSAIFLKIRPVIWSGVRQFLEEQDKEHSQFYVQGNSPSLVKEFSDLYFKHGSKDLSGYSLPELTYRRKTMASIAGFCKLNNMGFTAEEFLDLWTTPFSDCVAINSWHAPTVYSIIEFMKNNPDLTKEQAIQSLRKEYSLNNKWEKLATKYWDKIELFKY